MACSVCAGYLDYNCPCCGKETVMVECPDCDGKGVYYFAFDTMYRRSARVTELTYEILPDNEDEAKELNARWCKGCIEVCETCRGDGEIPEDD